VPGLILQQQAARVYRSDGADSPDGQCHPKHEYEVAVAALPSFRCPLSLLIVVAAAVVLLLLEHPRGVSHLFVVACCCFKLAVRCVVSTFQTVLNGRPARGSLQQMKCKHDVLVLLVPSFSTMKAYIIFLHFLR
jgi:hypothetical protein